MKIINNSIAAIVSPLLMILAKTDPATALRLINKAKPIVEEAQREALRISNIK